MSYLYLDIETIPVQDPSKADAIVANAAAPGNYKKPESIEKWRQDNRADILSKTAKDVRQIRKADRQRNRNTGVARPAGKMKGRGFDKTAKTPKIDKSALPPLQRRSLFVAVEG